MDPEIWVEILIWDYVPGSLFPGIPQSLPVIASIGVLATPKVMWPAISLRAANVWKLAHASVDSPPDSVYFEFSLSSAFGSLLVVVLNI